MEFAGELEVHLTVEASMSIEEVRACAARHGLRCTHIVLARGAHASQILLTHRTRSTRSVEIANGRRLSVALAADGLAVKRLKIEAALGNEGVPATDAAAVALLPDVYFEHHVKLLWSDADLAAVERVAASHCAHLSRSAFGPGTRFVTQRCLGMGAASAGVRLDDLLADLRAIACTIAGVERELVVFDDNLRLDEGWIA